jgi:hypothetical protein
MAEDVDNAQLFSWDEQYFYGRVRTTKESYTLFSLPERNC